jgi:hypothetical protein
MGYGFIQILGRLNVTRHELDSFHRRVSDKITNTYSKQISSRSRTREKLIASLKTPSYIMTMCTVIIWGTIIPTSRSPIAFKSVVTAAISAWAMPWTLRSRLSKRTVYINPRGTGNTVQADQVRFRPKNKRIKKYKYRLRILGIEWVGSVPPHQITELPITIRPSRLKTQAAHRYDHRDPTASRAKNPDQVEGTGW